MAFLDNSGDIILDAVLTDTGRMRLAKGDGSFNITKFALGDDEINYALYDKNHASGSAYYDVEILQTPVLEAFTNNTSLLKSKLISVSRTNLLYLPVIKHNTTTGLPVNGTNNLITITVDTTTSDTLASSENGIRWGTGYTGTSRTPVIFDQGIDSNAIGDGGVVPLDADLVETQYIIEMDNRLGYLADENGNQAVASFIDDDDIASYYLSQTTNSNFFGPSGLQMGQPAFLGPRGTRIKFLIGPSTDLAYSTYLFTQLGSTATNFPAAGTDSYHIDTTIRITGATTGYRVDLPVRFVKNQ